MLGSVDFVRPRLDDASHDNLDESKLLTTISGVRCSMPYTIKCASNCFFATDGNDNNNDSSTTSTTAEQKKIEQIANEIFDKTETHLSNFNPSSEVNRVNSLTMDEVHTMSEPLTQVILCSKELVKLTRGVFDPSCKPLLNHYENMARRGGGGGGSTTHPESTRSRSASNVSTTENDDGEGLGDEQQQHVDMETIRRQRRVSHVVDYWRSLLDAGFTGDPSDSRISKTVQRLLEIGQWSAAFSVGVVEHQDGDEKVHTIKKKHIDARLDLSGIAKGWAVDKLVEALPSPCYVDWGGDIKVKGKHPSGRPWVVAVHEPPSLGELKMKVAKAKEAGQVGPIFTLSDENVKSEDGKKAMKEYLALIELRDGEAVATSGDYESK